MKSVSWLLALAACAPANTAAPAGLGERVCHRKADVEVSN
jgi:hypothetical protein